MTAPSHLRALQAIELAIRRGSMKAAAAELSITPAALGQRIRSLEDYLGYDLVARGRSGIRPTQELEKATAHLGAAFRELETACGILDFQRVNEIHITADSDWAELWLKPRLRKFQADNPNTLFCVNGIGDVPVRLGESDCEIWFGQERGGNTEKLLFHDYLVPVSSPENTQRISALPADEMLEGFPLLHLNCYTRDAGDVGWIEWIKKFGHRKTAPGIGIRYQRVLHALEAVYASAGFLVCGMALVDPQLEKGTLSLAFPIAEGEWTRNAYRISFREHASQRGPLAQFREWLLKEAESATKKLKDRVGKRQ